VTFTVREEVLAAGGVRLTATVTWQRPRSPGLTVRAYNVTECLSMPTPMPADSEGPCLVEHTALPAAALQLAASAPASAGQASWTWIDSSECGWPGPAFEVVVLAAYGAAGHSVFAIASPGLWTTKVAIC
jgi:hypothetical protein